LKTLKTLENLQISKNFQTFQYCKEEKEESLHESRTLMLLDQNAPIEVQFKWPKMAKIEQK